MAEKPEFQDLWSSHRRNTRSGTGALALPSTALSVPPDIDRTALFDPRTRVGRIQKSTRIGLQYHENGQGEFPRGLYGMARKVQGCHVRTCARQKNQEKNSAIHTSQTAQCLFERQTKYASLVDISGLSKPRTSQYEQWSGGNLF